MRAALAALVSYVAYFIWIAVMFSLLWMVTGASFAYHPGTTQVTPAWLAIATPINLVGAYLCALLARRITSRKPSGAISFAVLVLILGIGFATMNVGADRSLPAGKTPATLSAQDAGRYSIQPTWYDFTIPVLAAASALFAARRPAHGRAASVQAAA